MDLEKAVEFLLDNQAKNEAQIAALTATVDRLVDAVRQLAEAGLRTQHQIAELAAHTDQMGAEWRESQAQQDAEWRRQREEWKAEDRKRGKELDDRIDRLVSAIGALIPQQPPPQPAT
jgi:peptidoglycan hydrolase CwlO-like protein